MSTRRPSDRIFLQFIDTFYKVARRRATAPSIPAADYIVTEIGNYSTMLTQTEENNLKDDVYAPVDAVSLKGERSEFMDNVSLVVKTYILRDGSEEVVQIEEW